MQPELIADYKCQLGEGPLWHPGEKRLYWVDIPEGRMFRYHPASGTHEQCYEGEAIGGFTIQSDGMLLLFMAKGAVKIWRDGALSSVFKEIPDERNSRFNDAIADPAGRVFSGTLPAGNRLGRLYRLDPDRTLTPILDGIGCSNGMGFTPDLKQMYYTDSKVGQIYRFEYDRDTGTLANRQIFAQIPGFEGVPDGLTVDVEGYIWSARWDGGCLIRYAPNGSEVLRIPFPAKKVTSVTFGGEDYSEVYVTTAGGNDKQNEGSGAGALFRLKLGIRGVPEFPSKICV